MTLIRSSALAGALVAFAGASLAACGGESGSGGGGPASSASEDRAIRDAAKELAGLRPPGDAERICELLSSRGEAQIAGLAGASLDDGCVSVVRTTSPGYALTARQVDRAKLTVRADRALLVYGADEGRIGMRKVDGEWLVDDLLAATLDGPLRPSDPALTEGTDEQQVRAVLRAVSGSARAHDDARLCGLLSAGAEARVIAGALIAGARPGSTHTVKLRSCAQALRRIRGAGGGGDDDEAFAGLAGLSSARARVTIRDGRASVSDASGDAVQLVREEGRWLVGSGEDALAAG